MCCVASGVYIPVEADGHWIKRMWTYTDITNAKVRIKKMNATVVTSYCTVFLLHIFKIADYFKNYN